jgi:hypothetical protein
MATRTTATSFIINSAIFRSACGVVPFQCPFRIHGQFMILICRVPPALEGTVNVSTLRWHGGGDGAADMTGGE